MNVSLTKELEKLVKLKVKSGRYASDSEVIRDALRRAFCSPVDPDRDTPELAEMIREGQKGPYAPYKKGDLQRSLAKVLSTRRHKK